MSKVGFGELCCEGKLHFLGNHGVNVNVIGY